MIDVYFSCTSSRVLTFSCIRARFSSCAYSRRGAHILYAARCASVGGSVVDIPLASFAADVAEKKHTSSSSSSPLLSCRGNRNLSVEATTPAQVEEMFRLSVLARTISNAQLRRYVEQLQPKDHTLASAAVRGAEKGGLRVDAKTNEVLLSKLMDGGQLRASMDVYRGMINNRMTPTANTYATLMHMCLQREMPEACQKMFEEMTRRGQSPNTRNYELYVTSLGMENPPKWEKAIEVFDHISRERRGKHLTAVTYNSLMKVYLNMTPFDWRVVYNCYYELRNRRPSITLQWESYLLVAEALRRGNAGYIRRCLTYLDAWFCITPLRSMEFLVGMTLYLIAMMVLKALISWVVVFYYERSVSKGGNASESFF